jgi:HSP20 family molecular chaperone IbpA
MLLSRVSINKDIDIQISGQNLFIEIKHEQVGKPRCNTEERWLQDRANSIQLHFPVDADRVEARFSNGLLVIELPRLTFEGPRKIAIKP